MEFPNEVVYLPPGIAKENPWRRMTSHFIQSRELIWRLFVRNFKVRYKQSLLGWLWVLLLPAVGVGTFYALYKTGAVNLGSISEPYVLFGYVGLMLWQVFAAGLVQTTDSLVSASSFISKINFSKESLIIAEMGQPLVEFIVRWGLLVLVYLLTGWPLSWRILTLPLWIIPLVILAVGLGFMLSVLNTILRDIRNILNVVLGFALFLIPIMYATPPNTANYFINRFNPLFVFINSARDFLFERPLTLQLEFVICLVASVIIFWFGWLVFDKAQSKIAEVI